MVSQKELIRQGITERRGLIGRLRRKKFLFLKNTGRLENYYFQKHKEKKTETHEIEYKVIEGELPTELTFLQKILWPLNYFVTLVKKRLKKTN